MAGPEFIFDFGVIFGFLILIINDERNRRTGGFSFKYAGENLHRIAFLALRRIARL